MGQCCSSSAAWRITSEDESTPPSPSRRGRKSNIQENLVRTQNMDFHTVYEVVAGTIGEGSISTISKIRRRKSAVGGSARPCFVHAGTNRRIGSFSSGKSSSHTEEYFALKEIDLSRVKTVRLQELRNELSLLKTLDHPNIIKAYEAFLLHHPPRLALVMEYCSGGDLWSHVPYTEAQAARIAGQILSAVAYLHERNVVHRDIKFENILFESEKADADIKLIDFGLARVYLNEPLTEHCGTLYTMSPEVIRGEYTHPSDMWSVGVVVYMLLTGAMPFDGETRAQMRNRILTRQMRHVYHWRKNVSSLAKDFVCSLLVIDQNTRLTAKQALRHRWLSKNTVWSDEKPTTQQSTSIITWSDAQTNLVRYAEGSDFKRLALIVIAKKSTTEEIFELRRCFHEIDTDHNGTVTYKEFRTALDDMNYSDEEIKSIFRKVDLYGDGVIQYTEFLAATLETQGRIDEYRIAEAFDLLDSDDSGYISKENLCKVLGSAGTNEHVSALIHELDVDGDGRISYTEFKRVFDEAVDTIVRKMSQDEGLDC